MMRKLDWVKRGGSHPNDTIINENGLVRGQPAADPGVAISMETRLLRR